MWKEKIEDGVFYVFISLVVGNPYYQEGILIGKIWGNPFAYTFLTPPLSFSVVRESPYLLLLPVTSQWSYRSLEQLYR